MLQLGGFQWGESTGISLLQIDYVKLGVLKKKEKSNFVEYFNIWSHLVAGKSNFLRSTFDLEQWFKTFFYLQTRKISLCITNISLLTISSPISVDSGDPLDVHTQVRQSWAFIDLHKTGSWTAALPSTKSWSLHYQIFCRNVILPFLLSVELVLTRPLSAWSSCSALPTENQCISAFKAYLRAATHHRANPGCAHHLVSPASQGLLCPALQPPHSTDSGWDCLGGNQVLGNPFALSKGPQNHWGTSFNQKQSKHGIQFNKGNKFTRCCIWRQKMKVPSSSDEFFSCHGAWTLHLPHSQPRHWT